MTVISIAVLVYAGLCVFLYASQRSAMYYPTPEVHIPDVVDIRFESDGETLKIWLLANAGGPNAIIYFGGNAEDVAANIPDFRNIFPGHAVYLVNYRGYGGSTGSPSEAGLYKDALIIFDEIRSEYTRISVIGRSLGSAVASYLASVRDIDKLVLVTPFDSIENVAKKHSQYFQCRCCSKTSSIRWGTLLKSTLLFSSSSPKTTRLSRGGIRTPLPGRFRNLR